MAVANSIARQAQKPANNAIVTYMAGGVEIKLSPSIVKNYLVSGDPSKVTDQELAMFINLCKFSGLNPWLKEAYLIKYGTNPATLVTGIETYEKRAEEHSAYDGYENGIVVFNPETGEEIKREGTYYRTGEEIIGGWCDVYRKDRSRPVRVAVAFREVAQYKGNGELNSQWQKNPAWMVCKVATSRALKKAFPNTLAALVESDDVEVPSAAPVIPAEVVEVGVIEKTQQTAAADPVPADDEESLL